MQILVVSGFLGAGKTTFIRELIRRTGKDLVVLENEYGDNDLDSRSLQGSGEIEILEFMEGCVCCTKKDSFVNTILSISSAMNPEYLVVEPTGVGELGSILNNLQKIQYDRIQILPPILIAAPRSIRAHLLEFPKICKDQILHADKILFSKAENEDAAFLEETRRFLLDINPEAQIITTHYSRQDDDWWQSLLLMPGEVHEVASSSEEENRDASMEQLSVKNASMGHPGELMVFLEDILHGTFGELPRAKGVLPVGDEYLRFDVADGLYAITGAEEEEPKTQCVFIGRGIRAPKLLSRLHSDEVPPEGGRPKMRARTGR